VHLIVSLNREKKDFSNIFNKKGRFKKIDILYHNNSEQHKYKAEIQVRTFLEHTWAVCSHSKSYKGDFELPPQLERQFKNIAAILENADDNLDRVIKKINVYQSNREKYEQKDNYRKISDYDGAFKNAPSDPHVLCGYIEHKILENKNADFINQYMNPMVHSAIQECRSRIRLGIDIPEAFFRMGKLFLFLNDIYQSLSSYAKGIQLSKDADIVKKELDSIEAISSAMSDKLEGIEWILKFLKISLAAKFDDKSNVEGIKREHLSNKTPVIIVAGGCDPKFEKEIAKYGYLINRSFEDFEGTIISGGTDSGISKLVGDIPNENNSITKIGYLPYSLPEGTTIHQRYIIFYTSNNDFSVLELIQYWADIIASGISPSNVKLIGINGGKISAFEYRVALAFGAKVGILYESGREATNIFEDEDWKQVPYLAKLPSDSIIVKAFIHFDVPSKLIAKEERETLAKDVHEEYSTKEKERLLAKHQNVQKWDNLEPDYKNSNLYQIDFYEQILKAAGFEICKKDGPDLIKEFSPGEIDLMARREHERWIVERLLNGWSFGKERDNVNKKHPALIPWDSPKLTDKDKEYNRETVKEIPNRLALVGYSVRRIKERN